MEEGRVRASLGALVERDYPQSRVASFDALGSFVLSPLGAAIAGPAALALGGAGALVLASGAIVATTAAMLLIPVGTPGRMWRTGRVPRRGHHDEPAGAPHRDLP